MPLWCRDSFQASCRVFGVAHLVCVASDWHCHQEHGCLALRWQWIKVIYKWCVHLCHHEKLIMDMNGEMCSKKMNECVHLDGTFKFSILCQCSIVEHTDAHAHFQPPSTKWWTIMLIIVPMINEMNKIVVQLQNWMLIIVELKIKIGFLKDMLISMFKVKGIIEINDDEENIQKKFYVDGNWCVEHHHIIKHVKDQSCSARNAMRASTKTTKRTWCCKLPDSLCSLLLNVTALRPNEMATITRAGLTHRLLCRMNLSRWHRNISSRTC